MRRAFIGFAAALALVLACGETFKPESMVEELRVLGIRSEPAELAPGETAALTALVVDPSDPARRNTVFWLSCDPDPLDLGRSACSDFSQLEDPTAFVSAADGGALPPGMRVAGFGERAFYTAPANLFAQLPPEDARRRSGAVAQLLLIAVAEEVAPTASQAELEALMARVRAGEVASVVSIFRVRVTEQTPRNQNPERFDLLVDGRRVPHGAHATFRAGDDALVEITAPEGQAETYQQLVPGGEEERTEKLLAAPYSTGGRFFLERLAVNEGVSTAFTPPGGPSPDPAPQPGRGRFWVVVRDTRGGQAWQTWRMHLCEPVREVPAVSAVLPSEAPAPQGGGAVLTLQGERLEDVLDVLVGGEALRDAVYSPARDAFVGTLPPLGPGTHEVLIRTRSCVELPTGHKVAVQ